MIFLTVSWETLEFYSEGHLYKIWIVENKCLSLVDNIEDFYFTLFWAIAVLVMIIYLNKIFKKLLDFICNQSNNCPISYCNKGFIYLCKLPLLFGKKKKPIKSLSYLLKTADVHSKVAILVLLDTSQEAWARNSDDAESDLLGRPTPINWSQALGLEVGMAQVILTIVG